MRRKTAFVIAAALFALPGTALADPDFGPGNSQKGPQDGKCHPPGQVLPSPECKG
jgi:hypothetical protein